MRHPHRKPSWFSSSRILNCVFRSPRRVVGAPWLTLGPKGRAGQSVIACALGPWSNSAIEYKLTLLQGSVGCYWTQITWDLVRKPTRRDVSKFSKMHLWKGECPQRVVAYWVERVCRDQSVHHAGS